jgi:hypothetical protein
MESAPELQHAAAALQPVTIATPGAEGSSCTVQAGGAVYQVTAPGTVQMKRIPGTMIVNCFKGEALRGSATAAATYAPREADAADCISCRWPSTVTVAMRLNGSLMDVPVLRQGP